MGCLMGSGVIFIRILGEGSHLLPQKKMLQRSSGFISLFQFWFEIGNIKN